MKSGKLRTALRYGKYIVLLVFLGLAVHLLLPKVASLEHMVVVIEEMTWWAVGLAATFQFCSYLAGGLLLQGLVHVAGQRLSIGRGAVITAAAASVGLVAGGAVSTGAATYRWVRGSGVSKSGALLTGWLPWVISHSLLLLMGSIGIWHLFLINRLTTIEIIGFVTIAVLLGAVVFIAVWGVGHRARLEAAADAILGRWARLRHRPYDGQHVRAGIERYLAAWDTLKSGGWRIPVLGGCLVVVCDMLTLYFFFIAAGYPIRLGALVTGYGLPLLLAKAAFMIPGGVGVVETLMTALYAGLGVPEAVAVVVIIGYRAISFWLPILIGFPLAAALTHQTPAVDEELRE